MNNTDGLYATVSAGQNNVASGDWSTVSGGNTVTVSAIDGWSAGGEIQAYQAVGVTPDPTTTSSTFTDLEEMTVTFTPTSASNPILIQFTGSFHNSLSTGGGGNLIQVTVDGVAVPNSERIMSSIGNRNRNLPVIIMTTLSAASHTINVQWKTTSGTLLTAYSVERVLTVIEFDGGTLN